MSELENVSSGLPFGQFLRGDADEAASSFQRFVYQRGRTVTEWQVRA